MQTFMPLPSFVESAAVLDNRRLGKQRVECKQILRALGIQIGEPASRPLTGWVNHPATRMWREYESALVTYAICVCNEWRRRGFEDSLLEQFERAQRRGVWFRRTPMPPFLHREDFHASHRSNLLRKDPVHYGQFGWREPSDLPYVWPV